MDTIINDEDITVDVKYDEYYEIIESIKKQIDHGKTKIDDGKTKIDQGNHHDYDILGAMYHFKTDILYRVVYKLIIDSYFLDHDEMIEYANSDHPWSLLQNYSIRYSLLHCLDIQWIRSEKIIGITTINIYGFLIVNLIESGVECSEEFINLYGNVDDPNTNILWTLLEMRKFHKRNGIFFLKIFLKLIRIKPLVFCQKLNDEINIIEMNYKYYSEDNYINLLKKEIVGKYMKDVTDIEKISITDIFDLDNIDKHFVKKCVKVFGNLSMSEQIKFGVNIDKHLTDKHILGEICVSRDFIFVDYIFENFPVCKWFAQYYELYPIDSYFGKKLLSIDSELKDKIMFSALYDNRVLGEIFPDITQYDIVTLVERNVEKYIFS